MAFLPTRPLGKNGPEVARLGFGTMGLSVFYGPAKPDSERFALLDKAHELGETFWDSAMLYGDSEELIGRWLAANPDKSKDVFIATKFYFRWVDGERVTDTSAENCKRCCNGSLERLGVPVIDLFYAHRLNPETPVEETVQAMAELKAEGKIKYLGLSECSSESLRRACKVHHIAAVQVEYSPFSLEIESEQIRLLKTARELGVAVVAYSPLSRGILSGQIRSREDFGEGDFRAFLPRYSEENFSKNLEVVDKLKELASAKGCTVSQLTLAWLLAQGDDIFPIPGTTRINALVENVESLKVELTVEEEKKFRSIIQEAEVLGSRYPDSLASTLYVDTVPLTMTEEC
ncbi:NADP-dependent oxidoreductase domain-containing protein [Aspergillus cavernicola]|uniref:NADP-dependent oxidoreductase domain-containing protein n=1 Tax=Aspergillus cavernicola TaxID=176166 RepID=A0ABR4IVW3_9EURO